LCGSGPHAWLTQPLNSLHVREFKLRGHLYFQVTVGNDHPVLGFFRSSQRPYFITSQPPHEHFLHPSFIFIWLPLILNLSGAFHEPFCQTPYTLRAIVTLHLRLSYAPQLHDGIRCVSSLSDQQLHTHNLEIPLVIDPHCLAYGTHHRVFMELDKAEINDIFSEHNLFIK
jgi:hypothetical protein